MSKDSAGLIPYRLRGGELEVLIGHMGGPVWASKDDRAWSIIKGERDQGEDPLAAARREFEEETGSPPPEGPLLALGEIRQAGGKRVTAWALEAELDPARLRSGTFELEWPPRSGRREEFAELDRFDWCDPRCAGRRLVAGQAELVERLKRLLADAGRCGETEADRS
ncbi:MAG: NUDIX domain-containing protein [Solirubrobacteraceae bacterium]